jgi:hypothetical protein
MDANVFGIVSSTTQKTAKLIRFEPAMLALGKLSYEISDVPDEIARIFAMRDRCTVRKRRRNVR